MITENTKVYNTIKSDADRINLQNDLNKLQKWSQKWLLKFHPDKCKVLCINSIATEKYNYTLNINVTTHNLEHTTSEKDIGITFDQKLNFEIHINNKVKTANMMSGLIRRSYKYLTPETFVPLYKSLVRVHFDYATAVWSPYKQKEIELVESVQRRATKQLPGMKNLPYEERLKSLNLPTLSYRRHRADMIEVYKIMNGLYDPEVAPILPLASDISQVQNLRGHKHELFKRRSHKKCKK